MGDSNLIDPRPMHRFDEDVLNAYLKRELQYYSGPLKVQQFEGGQSNPTFLLTTPTDRYVLRKKPPGDLLPSAHAIEREYRLYKALEDTDVPVPKTYLFSEDRSIVGTPFFLMEYIEGRVFKDPSLPNITPADRRAIYSDMNRVLAALHTVDYESIGLSNYGKPGNYFVRQTGRWTKQYLAAQTDKIHSMDKLIRWLPENTPDDDTTSIVHGDYQFYNMMYHPTDPRCVAVLDWELSTLGHPLADLAYNCMKYHERNEGKPLSPEDGIPSESEVVDEYCQLTGRRSIENWNFCLAFSFFRLASICQGVYKRGLQGNASSSTALEMKDRAAILAETAWRIANR
jgi:aminoglycoside phosphotransferase (APT) family kinase protein